MGAAETFPPGEFIRDELKARGLTERGFEALLFSVGCTPTQVLACEIAAYIDDKDHILDADTAGCLAKAFGISAEMWMNLDRQWREASLPASNLSQEGG
jgi:HTH-type transcriptional regulator/antitoxin HigA